MTVEAYSVATRLMLGAMRRKPETRFDRIDSGAPGRPEFACVAIGQRGGFTDNAWC